MFFLKKLVRPTSILMNRLGNAMSVTLGCKEVMASVFVNFYWPFIMFKHRLGQ